MLVQRKKHSDRALFYQAKKYKDEIKAMELNARCELWDRTTEPLKSDDPDFDKKWESWIGFLSGSHS